MSSSHKLSKSDTYVICKKECSEQNCAVTFFRAEHHKWHVILGKLENAMQLDLHFAREIMISLGNTYELIPIETITKPDMGKKLSGPQDYVGAINAPNKNKMDLIIDAVEEYFYNNTADVATKDKIRVVVENYAEFEQKDCNQVCKNYLAVGWGDVSAKVDSDSVIFVFTK